MNDDIMNKLQAPFAPDEIEWRVGSTNKEKTKGLALAYVTNRAIQNRLDEVFGCFGWKNEYREWKGKSQICGISVKHEIEWITKWDGADDSNMEGTKGGLSDAMKRAAYQWGIGRYLYKLKSEWMPIEPAGKSYRLKQIPSLPKWALPDNYSGSPIGGTVIPEDDVPETFTSRAERQTTTTPPRTEKPKGKPTCTDCNTTITAAVKTYSEKNFGKPLCLDCQKKNAS